MNIDNQDNQDNSMNLNSDTYNSILCDQGALFNKQRNELSKSSKFNKDNVVSNDFNATANDTIYINSSSNVQEGFTSEAGPIIEGFHENPPSKLSDVIQDMDEWMKREFRELKVLQDEYASLQNQYNNLDEKFGTEARDYLARTTKDNNFNGKTIQFKDGEMGYVTEKGFLRDYDDDAYVQIGDKNKCDTEVIDPGISRNDFISLDSQKLGPKMSLNKSDIQTIRIHHKNNYLHISELEAYDSNNNNILMPKNKEERVSIYCQVDVKINDYSSNSDEYRMFLTYNGKKVSEDIAFKANKLPKITAGPPVVDNFGAKTSNRFYGVQVAKNYGKDKQGMRILYYTMANCNGWSPKKYIAKTHHVGSINFNWGSGRVIDKYRDFIGTYIDGYIIAPVTGTIQLYSDSDDGQGFWWQKKNLWDGLNLNHGRSDAGRYFANVQVKKGEYYYFSHLWRECGGGANVRLFWTLPGKNREIIPAKYFTIGGASSGAKRGILYHDFTKVSSVVNGFEVNANGKKLIFEKLNNTYFRRTDQEWPTGLWISGNDPYKVMKITDGTKVALPSFNPFVESAHILGGNWSGPIGWTGYSHYPIDGIMKSKWPNAVHSLNNRDVTYDINLMETGDIERIRVRNRIDCCQDRLNGAKLQLLDSNKKLIKEFALNGEQEQVFYIENEPKGTTCGSEGKNVKVTKIGDIGEAEFIGCYQDRPERAMKWEGKWGTFEQCKQYALDNKSPYFALQASRPDRDIHACMISDSLNDTLKYGKRSDEKCPMRPYSQSFGPVGSGWTNAVYTLNKTNYNKVEEQSKNVGDTINTYTGVSVAECMNECEKTGECNAIEYDSEFLTKMGKEELYVGKNNGDSVIRVNKNVDEYFNLDGYEIVIKLKVIENYGNWRNIFHYGNSNGERAPALWLFPNFSTRNWRLHFRIRTERNWNDGLDFDIPSRLRKLHKSWTIRIVVDTTQPLKITAFVDDTRVASVNLNTKVARLNNRRFYIKDPWYYARWTYKVESLVLKDAFAKIEKGKCETKTSQDLTEAPGTNSVIYNKLSQRPFVHGKENLGKIGYVDEKGLLHEYPQNMILMKNNYSLIRNVDSPGNDIFNRVTESIEEARNIANSRRDVAGFVRLPNGRTWFKNRNMYPINPNGPQRFYRNLQLYHKEVDFKNNATCTNKFNEIDSFEWNNYTKGPHMTMDTKCTISNYTDKTYNSKNNLSTRLNVLNQKIKEKIERIKSRNSRLNPYLEKSYAKIIEIVTETENNDNIRSELLGNRKEGMATMTNAYNNNNINNNLASYQDESDSGSALLALLGLTGLIMGFSYMKK